MIEMNDTIGVMLREQMQEFIVREQLVWDFIQATSGPPERRVFGARNISPVLDDRRGKGILYGIGDYKLGIFVKDNEFRFVLMNDEFDTLQTASSMVYETIDRSHFAVVLKEGTFSKFALGSNFMTPATDDERGNAVMKLMMINEAAR